VTRVQRLSLIVVVAVIAAVSIGAIWLYRHAISTVTDCYMQDRVAEMIIEHLERNRGAWPKDWENLTEAHEICEARSGHVLTLDEIRDRCAVDFTAEPGELVKAAAKPDEPPFHVVRLISGESHYWSGGEPNQQILDYLKAAAKRPEDYTYPAKPVDSEKTARRALLNREASWHLDKGGYVVSIHMGSNEGSPRFSDDDLVHVGTLHQLQELNLENSNITDDGLLHLSGLKKLRTLYLAGTHVTDEGLQRLTTMEDLEELTLAFCNIKDDGVDYLQQLPSLKLLNLNYTNIGDAGIDALCNIKSLNDVMVGNTYITSAGAERLKEAFPGARLYYRPRNSE
jgi:hypothetical protein